MIKLRKDGEEIIVSLFQLNKINILFSDHIEEELTELVENPGARIIFDLSTVKFIDSAGFGMLKKIDEISRENSSEFILCNLNMEVQELFKLLNLDGSLRISERVLINEPLLMEVE